MVEVAQDALAVALPEPDLPGLQSLLQCASEDRQPEAPPARAPVDVEPVRGLSPHAVAQHLPHLPIRVLRRNEGHVVRHDIHDKSQTVLAGGLGQCDKTLLATEILGDPCVVEDVVPVLGTPDRRQAVSYTHLTLPTIYSV